MSAIVRCASCDAYVETYCFVSRRRGPASVRDTANNGSSTVERCMVLLEVWIQACC